MSKPLATLRALPPQRTDPADIPKNPGRTPADHAEVTRRVAIYARQFERTGRIAWLPHRDTLVTTD